MNCDPVYLLIDLDSLWEKWGDAEDLVKKTRFPFIFLRNALKDRDLVPKSEFILREPIPGHCEKKLLRTDQRLFEANHADVRTSKYGLQAMNGFNMRKVEIPVAYKKKRCRECEEVTNIVLHKSLSGYITHEAFRFCRDEKKATLAILSADTYYRHPLAVLRNAGFNVEFWHAKKDGITVEANDMKWKTLLPQSSTPVDHGERQLFWDISHICVASRQLMGQEETVPFDFLEAMTKITDRHRTGRYSSIYRSESPPFMTQRFLTKEFERLFQINRYHEVAFPLGERKAKCHHCGVEWKEMAERYVDASLICGLHQAALELENKADLVIVSSDNDFVPAAEYLHSAGNRVTIWGFQEKMSYSMQRDRFPLEVRYLDRFLTVGVA